MSPSNSIASGRSGVRANNRFPLFSWFLLLIGLASSVAGEPLDPEHAAKMAKGTDLFKREVRSILSGRCVKCHGGEKTEGKLDLNTREALMKGGETGAAIVPGKSSESLLYKLVAHLEEPNMPEDGAKLSNDALAAISRWIDLGAPYDKPLVVKDEDPLAWTRRTIDEAQREFWSFQPLTKPTVPNVGDAPWKRNSIDAFILKGLRDRKMEPNPLAERRQWIRRAYYDLTGLPPSADEVEQFLNDTDPEAYSKRIDRLLDSPHFGERWARHWLDVARFAESHGFEQDYDRPHAYHFRDFVIKALNQDMPFDQFVRWQIAGDEYEPNNPLALMATGFLGAGVFPTQLTEKEFESARYDELDDMVATLGTAMLGLTLGCARCHDHKYDPIPAADYYRLVSTFASTIRSNIELDLNPQDSQSKLDAWEHEHRPLVAELEAFDQQELPKRFDEWIKQAQTKGEPDSATKPWTILDLIEYTSKGGATLTRQEDGSILAGGVNPDFDAYTLVAETHMRGVTAIRLEALAHASMAKKGPGRAPNGNIGLSRITLQAQPLAGGEPVEIKLVDPIASFQQNAGNLSIAAALDGDAKSGWAVDPQFGKDHAAVFATEKEFGFEGGTRLKITLEFGVNNRHNIGRPRISLSTAARPVALDAPSQRQGLVELQRLASRGEALNATQRAQALVWYRPLDAEWLRLNDRVQKHLAAKPKPNLTQVMVTSEGLKPIPHHADDRGFPHFYKESFFLKRGDVAQKQGVAEPAFLQILTNPSRRKGSDVTSHWQEPVPAGARTSFRRRALANWITDTEDGAGQLLARVIVNRLWQHHFGRGIVASPNDFGFQGQRPSHPELLDWLANELINNGWRLKPLHKLMMTSSTYLQTSDLDEQDYRIDPENIACWRFLPRRLEAEVIRDAMLQVSGQLDETMFGPGTLDENHKRRSIYFTVKRSKLIPSMQLFDTPEPLASVGNRPSTTIAPQALMFLNNAQVRILARSFADRIAGPADRPLRESIRQGYRMAVSRLPSNDELADAEAFVASQLEVQRKAGKAPDRILALTDLCQVLFSLNEFVYVD